jgi:lipoprotein-anchoring transpeptidase ErfK/SrfK
VSPSGQVVVSVQDGTLQTCTVTTGSKTVKGKWDDTKTTWTSTGALGYGKTYTVAVSVVDSAGTAAQQTSTFTTLKPKSTAQVAFQANALASLNTGGTYGVGQVIAVRFSRSISNKDAAEKAMTVVTEPAVEGRWRWIDSQTAHWRPAKYWASGTKITVAVSVLGVNLGSGVYGAANASTHFSIGPSRIAIADNNTHIMKAYIDGKLVRTIPVSLGKGGYTKGASGETIDFWTRTGPHVLLSKQATYQMTSSSFGITNKNDPNYYDSTVRLCNRISYSGEFVHMADWNIPKQGHQNTSHGCINVGPANAQWFYDTFQVGDVVEVKGTPKPLPLTDGLGDWTIPWSQW